MKVQEPKIVCYSCKFSWGYLGNEAAMAAQIKNWIPIICCNQLESKHIMNAFANGAGGVLILACPEGDCRLHEGQIEMNEKVALLKKSLETYGIEPERIRLIHASDPEGTTIPELIAGMKETVKAIESRHMVEA